MSDTTAGHNSEETEEQHKPKETGEKQKKAPEKNEGGSGNSFATPLVVAAGLVAAFGIGQCADIKKTDLTFAHDERMTSMALNAAQRPAPTEPETQTVDCRNKVQSALNRASSVNVTVPDDMHVICGDLREGAWFQAKPNHQLVVSNGLTEQDSNCVRASALAAVDCMINTANCTDGKSYDRARNDAQERIFTGMDCNR